ncbi:hypothetical protein HK104_003698 [Borealophlyctis nickersoniae]|nr:hypothetical protein HK104_003698 [Borealophlyctis nickersoniae]
MRFSLSLRRSTTTQSKTDPKSLAAPPTPIAMTPIATTPLLPPELLPTLLVHLPNPTPFLRTCRSLYAASKDPCIRAKWIKSQVNVAGVAIGPSAFALAVRRRMCTANVIRSLTLLGCPVPSRTAGENVPAKNWQGWSMIDTMLALRGDEECVAVAAGLGLVTRWDRLVEVAIGAGNWAAVAGSISWLVNQGDCEQQQVESDKSDSGESDGEEGDKKAPLKAIRTKQVNIKHPLANLATQIHLLTYATQTASPSLLMCLSTLIPPTSQAWMYIAPLLLTPGFIHSLKSLIESGHIDANTLLITSPISRESLPFITNLVKSGAVDVVGEGAKFTLRRAALEGNLEVVQALVESGIKVDRRAVQSAKDGGNRKCVKFLSKAIKA